MKSISIKQNRANETTVGFKLSGIFMLISLFFGVSWSDDYDPAPIINAERESFIKKSEPSDAGVYLEPVKPYVDGVDEYNPTENCQEATNFKITNLSMILHYRFVKRDELDYPWYYVFGSRYQYDSYFHVVKIDYEVTCANKLRYRGTEYLASPYRELNNTNKEEEHQKKIAEMLRQVRAYNGTFINISPDEYIKADGTITKDPIHGEWGHYTIAQINIPAILQKWERQKLKLYDFTYTGTPGKLPQPVLLIHGLESDFKVWGVEAKSKDTTDFQNGFVKSYDINSLPYLFAKSYGLSIKADSINNNGIYFYQAPKNSLLAWDSENSQSKHLYNKIEDVLNSHFKEDSIDGKIAWKVSNSYKIDLIAHSQGGLAIREMLKALPKDTSSANPANHINRVITVNTPHIGSALAINNVDLVKGRFPGVAILIDDVDNPKEHLLVEADIGLDWLERRLVGYMAGDGILGILGFFGGADVKLTVKGSYLGPYKAKAVAKNSFGSSTQYDEVMDPEPLQEARTYMTDTRNQGKRELGADGDFLRQFRLNPDGLYPLLPNGEKLVMLPMYSDSSHKILPEIFGSLGEEASKLCPKNEEGTTGCLAAASIFEDYAEELSGYDIDNAEFADSLWNALLDIQDGWLKQSDALVEAESQKFEDASGSFSSNHAAYKDKFLEPRNYAFHDAVAYWESVLHGPRFGNKGATQQGMDLLCALTPVCSGTIDANGVLSLLQLVASEYPRDIEASARSVKLQGNLASASTRGIETSSAMSVDLTGDFKFVPVYISEGKQGLSLNVGSTVIVHAEYVPGKGSFINGNQIVSEKVVTQPSIERKGDSLIVSFNNLSGKTFTTAMYVPNLQNNVTVYVLADVGAQMSSLAVSNGKATNPETQKRPEPPPGHRRAPVTLAAIHRESRGEHETNLSRPRMLVFNATDTAMEFSKVAYYFTADPARIPEVEMYYPKDSVILEHLGKDQYRFVIDLGNQKIGAKEFFPSKDGWQIGVHYNDWYDFDHFDDWSADYSIGFPKLNRKIVIYDKNDNIIWGKEPTKVETEENLIPEATITWKDEASWEANYLKPIVTVQNTGKVAIDNYHAELYFNVPTDKSLHIPSPEDWDSPESAPSVKKVSGKMWKLDLHFNKYILYPNASTLESKVGLHLTDWSNFDKTVCGVVLRDKDGNVLFGKEPTEAECEGKAEEEIVEPAQGIITLRDEAPWETNYLKPIITVKNTGNIAFSNYHAELYFSIPQGKSLAPLNDWDTPESAPSVKSIGGRVYKLDLNFGEQILYPDASTRENKVGLHLTDWSNFDKTLCGVVLRDKNGNVLFGEEPTVAECETYNRLLQPMYSNIMNSELLSVLD